MWGEMRDWLVYGCIDNDDSLIDDLTGPGVRTAPQGGRSRSRGRTR